MASRWKLLDGTIEVLDEVVVLTYVAPSAEELRLPLDCLLGLDVITLGMNKSKFLRINVAGDSPESAVQKNDPILMMLLRAKSAEEAATTINAALAGSSAVIYPALLRDLADRRRGAKPIKWELPEVPALRPIGATADEDDPGFTASVRLPTPLEPADDSIPRALVFEDAPPNDDGAAASDSSAAGARQERGEPLFFARQSELNALAPRGESLARRVARFVSPGPRTPEERDALLLRNLEEAAQVLCIPHPIHVAETIPNLLGEGTMRSGGGAAQGVWYSDDRALYVAPLLVAGLFQATIELVPGDRVLPVLIWSDVGHVEVTGREAVHVTTTVEGTQRRPLHVMSDTVKETQVTSSPAFCDLHFQQAAGPDVMLSLRLGPRAVRARLGTELAAVRRRAANSRTPAQETSSLAEELAQLADLRDRGVLSADEFAAAKAKLLD